MDGIKKIGRAMASLKWYEIAMCVIMLGISIYYAIQPQEGTPQWLAIINFVSGLCGVICVFLCAKANRMNFPFAVINTVVYMIYLFYFGIWATFWLEAIVYFPTNIISWIVWYKHQDNDDELLAKAKRLTGKQTIMVIASIIALTIGTHYFFEAVAGNTWMRFATKYNWNITVMQWLDASIFAIGIVATILEMLRYRDQYGLWILTNCFAIAQYAIKGDPVYTTKKVIYQVEAFIGIKNWTTLNKKNVDNE